MRTGFGVGGAVKSRPRGGVEGGGEDVDAFVVLFVVCGSECAEGDEGRGSGSGAGRELLDDENGSVE